MRIGIALVGCSCILSAQTGPPASTPKPAALPAKTMIVMRGADTMCEFAAAWQKAYARLKTGVSVNVAGGGSGSGFAALAHGDADIAMSTRRIERQELAAARDHGFEPVECEVARDAIAIFVHRDNPIESLTVEQLASIWGEKGAVERWSQLGLQLPAGTADQIVAVGRQNNAGVYQFFREAVLGRTGKPRAGVTAMDGSKDVLDFVGKTRNAIGYGGGADSTPDVKLVPIVAKAGARPALPTAVAVQDGSYPFARPLLLYFHDEPSGAVKSFVKWTVSEPGQVVLAQLGLLPPAKGR